MKRVSKKETKVIKNKNSETHPRVGLLFTLKKFLGISLKSRLNGFPKTQAGGGVV